MERGAKMKETRINANVTKKVYEDNKIEYWKKIKYDMNYYYTKLSENIYDQLGVKHEKTERKIDGNNTYLVTEDIQKDSELYLGNDITRNKQLSIVKEDLKAFLANKRNK